MTYDVFGGTLYLAQSNPVHTSSVKLIPQWFFVGSMTTTLVLHIVVKSIGCMVSILPRSTIRCNDSSDNGTYCLLILTHTHYSTMQLRLLAIQNS